MTKKIMYRGALEDRLFIAEDLGISQATLSKRISKFGAEYAVNNKNFRAVMHKYKGKTYTVKELGAMCGVCEETMRARMKRMSIYDAMGMTVSRRSKIDNVELDKTPPLIFHFNNLMTSCGNDFNEALRRFRAVA